MSAFIFAGGDPSKVDVSGYTKGDLLAADATGTLQPVAVGPDTDVLTADSAATEGVDWQAGGGGGGGVNTVFGRSGNVVAVAGDYTKAQVGLANVANSLQLVAASNLSDLTNVVTARTNLGLGTAATQNTGAFDAAGAAAAAQAASQPLDSDLTTIAGLSSATGNVIQGVAGVWAAQTPAQVKTSLILVKGDVGLGNVDNTSDANKPVSTAQQTALNLKANLASPTFTGTVTMAKSVNTPVVLTDSSPVTVDASLGNFFRLTLTGSGHTLGNPSNLTDGQMILFEIIQAAGGGNTLALDTKYSFGTGITSFTMTSTASKRDFLGVVYNLAADKLYVIALAQGY
jgi:hypothetical protein